MPKRQSPSELIGVRYGRLTILSAVNKDRFRKVLVKCECGREKMVALGHLKGGKIVSCGCNIKEHTILRNTKHGLSTHPIYTVWKGMKGRCYYKKNIGYNDYGGKGILVCDEWVNDFKCFYDWALQNGWEAGLVLDRIDGNLNYFPQNCRWVTYLQSGRNMSNNRRVQYNGVTKCVSEWAEEYGVRAGLIYDRLNKLGWSFEESLLGKNKTIC